MNPIAKLISSPIESYRLKNKPFVIISNNCWGYELYEVLGREYNTPFVGLFLFPECYLSFLENFETCINSEIKITKTSKYRSTAANYPIGVLSGGIEVHFFHYTSQEEAVSKWNRRMARLKNAKESGVPFFVKFCDRDGCKKDHLVRFHATPFMNKISIGVSEFDAQNHLWQPKLKDSQGDFVVHGGKLYRKRYHYFDIADWISRGKVHKSVTSRVLSLIT